MELKLADVPGVPKRTLRKLRKKRVTLYGHILRSKTKFLVALTGLSAIEVEKLYAACAAFLGARPRVLPHPETRPPDPIATGEFYFDTAMGGGLRPGTLTVAYSTRWKGAVRHAYGTGVTQCALMFASAGLRDDRGIVHVSVGPSSGASARARLQTILSQRFTPERAQRAIRDRTLFLAASDNEMAMRLADTLRTDIQMARMLAGKTYARYTDAEGGGTLGMLASTVIVVFDGVGKTLRPAVVFPRRDRWKGTTATTHFLHAARQLAVDAGVAVVLAGRGPGRAWKNFADMSICIRKYCWAKGCDGAKEEHSFGWDAKCAHRVVRVRRTDGKQSSAPMLITESGLEDDVDVAERWQVIPTGKPLPQLRKYTGRRRRFV